MKEQFSARATEVGSSVYQVEGVQAAVAKVSEILTSRGARLAVISPDLGDVMAEVQQALSAAGIGLIENGATAGSVEKADAGVSGAALGIAETGSLLIEGNDIFPRLATLLPLIHVAIVTEGSLVSTLMDAGEHLRHGALRGKEEGQVRYASFVTGPSRTADVEKTLSTGVHGPGELHIVLVSGN